VRAPPASAAATTAAQRSEEEGAGCHSLVTQPGAGFPDQGGPSRLMADAGGEAPPATVEADGAGVAVAPLFAGELTKVRVVLRVRPLLRREYGYPLAAERQESTRCVAAATAATASQAQAQDTASAALRSPRALAKRLRGAALRGRHARAQRAASHRAARNAAAHRPAAWPLTRPPLWLAPQAALVRAARGGAVGGGRGSGRDVDAGRRALRAPRSALPSLVHAARRARPPLTDASQVFATVADVVAGALRGCNGTIFAYGQTGTGKTYTMLGAKPKQHAQPYSPGFAAPHSPAAGRETPPKVVGGPPGYAVSGASRGIIPRAVEALLSGCDAARREGWSTSLSAVYLQQYGERLFDLRHPLPSAAQPWGRDKSAARALAGLELRPEPGGGVAAAGAEPAQLSTLEDVAELLRAGAAHRALRATELNDASSRSHAILQIVVEMTRPE